MKTLRESLLADIKDTLKEGDNEFKFNSNVKCVSIYGDDDAFNYLNKNALKNIKESSKETESLVKEFLDKIYYMNQYSNTKKETLIRFITYIENFKLTSNILDKNTINDDKVKTEILSEITNKMKQDNILPSYASLLRSSEGDRKNVFQIVLLCKQYWATLVFELK